ncbi:uncharacterized protein LOC109612917 [Musca domestica]|uniref:Uncharacterized protein LOC109612917 n=1 Tax=Musca domestica TaxID=7370 RepID=A0A9J7IFC4_MUSDO|nr:uncharacterized protein LOC109612917 [Musca domestica]
MLERQLLNNAEIEIKITYQHVKDDKIRSFVNMKLNICEALQQLKGMPIIRKLFLQLMSSSNLPCNCPIKGNILYSMKDFLLTEDTLPPYTPIINFNYSLAFYEDQQLIAKLLTQGSSVPKTAAVVRKISRKGN